ncbi:MAG: aspartate carbamoyltransferase regulatory subunit [archaeon GW2011_AR16]|nr:MAG: aspartate carbamoyltransferase regulatory subunit [archaeon GW2011_AR16]
MMNEDEQQPNNEKERERIISFIREGTVIDHIPHQKIFDLVRILALHKNTDGTISIATNLPSKKCGKKGIIKVEGRFLTPEEASKIAVICPHVTMNTIQDYRVAQKINLTLPRIIKNIVTCNNPHCISNHERIPTMFHVLEESPLKIKCNYCEIIVHREELIIP